jgi:signal transduction histidine kinase/FixJ family two-component response regulator
MSLIYLQPYATFDGQGRITKWSPALERLSGWPSSKAVGLPVSDLIVPLEPRALPELSGIATWEGIMALVGFAGAAPVPARARLDRLENGDHVLALDTTPGPNPNPAQSGTLDSPRLDAAHIFDSQRLGMILEHMRGFCYTVDRSLVFTSSVGAGLAGLNLQPNQLVGTSLLDLWNATDPRYEPLACHLLALAGIPRTYQDECMGRSLEYQLRPQLDEQGCIVGVIGVGFDVTEQEQAKEEQVKLSALLRQAQKMESIGRLAGGVAHDFNNQLTCIMGHLALAGKLIEPSSRIAHHLEEAIAAVESAATLTRQLLAFSRKQVIVPRPLHLGTLVDRLAGMLQRVIGESIRLNIACAEDLWQVHADPGQIEQVLMNLVVNARDAIEAQGEIHVRVRNTEVPTPLPAASGLLQCGRYVVLSVADTGRGVSDTVRSKLFEPFFTTKEVGAGTGLGLATVYGAVVQNRGNIIVDSKLGQGSTFSVYLPMSDDEPASSTTLEPQASTTHLDSCAGNETILLVEDEPSVLEVAQCTLEQLGYTVLACVGPGEALRVFREHAVEIDLLVTDVVMPRMNGKELATRIQSIRSDVLVLFTSGFSERILTEQGVVQGDVQFLNKPYRPFELASKVRSILNANRSAACATQERSETSQSTASGCGNQQAG